MLGAIQCWWKKEHVWEHRMFFIIMHYCRCKRCGKQVDYHSELVPESFREREREEARASEARYQAERDAHIAREDERYAELRQKLVDKARQLRKTHGWDGEKLVDRRDLR